MSRRSLIIAAIFAAAALLIFWRVGGDSGTGADSETATETGADGVEGAAETSENTPLRPPTRFGSGDTPGASLASAQVSGTVMDAETGQPVPWVDVIFKTRDAEMAATSDEAGRYQMELPAGQYALRAVGEGVIAKATPTLRIGGAAEVRRNIEVVRLGTIEGKVVGRPGGSGISGVEVLLRNDTKSGKAFPHEGEIGVAVSEGDGSFSLQVPPGTADLSVTLSQTTVFASVPKVPSGGEVKGVTIVMDRRGAIFGQVLVAAGGPAANSEILLSYRRTGTSAFDSRTASTDGAGVFAFEELAPGDYILEAQLPGHAPSAPTTVKLTEEELQVDVGLSLNKPANLQGRVVDAEGRPVGNVQVAQVWIGSKQRFEKIETYDNGEFSFSMVGPGPHIVRARKEGYADAMLRGVMAPASDLELKLVASGGIEGRITDAEGQPVRSFSLEVMKKGKKSGKSSRYRSKDGTFQLYPLNPGTYKVVVSAKGMAPKTLEAVVVPSGGYGDSSTALAAP